jgi:hypothetical protein
MTKINISGCFMIVLALVSCSGSNTKKIFVMGSGNVQINKNTVTLEPGNTHTEQEFDLQGDKLIATTPAGSSDFNVSETGLFILNLKTDTIVGSYQRTGTDETAQRITQEDLKKRIDSLQELVACRNVTTEKRNFCIPPNQLIKLTSNSNAQVIGPYRKIPRSFEAGKEYEIYKFYTNKEMHEIIEKLKPMVH